MITRLSKANKVGIFRSLVSDPAKTANFTKYNAIYGWNGSGKTTLSRIFAVLETGTLREIEFEDDSALLISTEDGNISVGKDAVPPANPDIKVFNEDFVNENLEWSSFKARPILIVGKENIKQKDSLSVLQGKRKKAEQSSKEYIPTIEVLRKAKDKVVEKARDNVMAELASCEGIKPKGRATLYRNYTVVDVNLLFSKEDLKFPVFTDEEKVARKDALSEKEQKEKINDYATDLRWVDEFMNEASELSKISLVKMATSNIESEVGENNDVREWLRAGHALHRNNERPVICKFCRNTIPTERLEDLDKYFDEALRSLIERIETLVRGSREKSIPLPENTEKIYKEFEKEYSSAREAFFIEKINLEGRIDDVRAQLARRKKNPFESSDFDLDSFKSMKAAFLQAVLDLNAVVNKHNTKTDEFLERRTQAAHDLELFLVGSFKSDYLEAVRAFEKETTAKEALDGEVRGYLQQERALEESLRDHKTGADAFNQMLRDFLGREDIKFSAEEEGYAISRSGKPAKHLSEGERNAIALVFFLMKLEEGGYNPEQSIIVIDDPVSSFDSQHTYQAYGFIKAKIKDLNPQQFFLLTHNFHFFRQLRNWLYNENRYTKKGIANSYILKCKTSKEHGRYAVIENLDPLLLKHNSEYSFLFKLIYDRAQEEDDPPLEQDYVSPNNLRKLLENFLSIKVPSDGVDIHGKFQKLLEDYPEYKIGIKSKNRIEAFAQDNSHPLYQDSVSDFDERLLGEMKAACVDVIDLIRGTDEKHFQHLLTQAKGEED